MSTEIIPATRYRMPAVFGPAPGPRQKADGTMWRLEETGTVHLQWATVEFLAVAEQLERLLPPGFVLRGEPVVSVKSGYFRDLYWLAGRQYGVLHPSIPVTYHGRDESIDGDFMPVIWEGLADAIVTGRDELGFPKLVADFPDDYDLDLDAGTLGLSVSWFDHTFFEMSMSGLAEVPDAVPEPPAPILTFKYVPATSVDGSQGADIASVTTSSPYSTLLPPAEEMAPYTFRRWTGTGDHRWNRARFEDLPTTFHVVNGLADLDVVELRGAWMTDMTAPGITIAGPGQTTVTPAQDNRFVQFPRSR